MEVILKRDEIKVRVRVRKYVPLQKNIIRSKVDDILELGLIRRNKISGWDCTPSL